MPTYVYQEILDDGQPGEVFEVSQSMRDDALTAHPVTGRPVRRLLQPPRVSTRGAVGNVSLDNANLDRLGFTKYEKVGDGKYEKTAGTGPATIDRGMGGGDG